MTPPVTPADYHHAGVITHAQRQALELRYADGLHLPPRLSYLQIGAILGISRFAARDRIRAGVANIAQHQRHAA